MLNKKAGIKRILDKKKQKVSFIKVFGSTISIVISKEKSHKLDIYKN